MSFPLRSICVALLGAATCLADPVSDRLQLVEARLAAVEQENAALKKQIATKADTAAVAVPQGKEAKLAVGGFIQFHGEVGDAPDARFPANDRLLMRRARIGLKGSFMENFDFVIQTDLGNNSLNSTSAFRAQLTDAFIVWNKYAFANVTAGQFRVPYGYEQLLGDAKIYTIERSLTNDMLTLPRQAGLMVGGTIIDKRLTYAVALGNGNGNNNSFNDNEQFDYIGRLTGTVFDANGVKLTAGVNGYTSYDTGTFTGHRTGRGADVQVFVGPFELDAELLRTHFDREVGADYDGSGWVLTGSYQIVPGKLRAVARYEKYDPNTTLGGDDTTERLIGLDYFIKGDDVKLSFNYVIGNPPGTTKHQDRLLSRLQVIF